MHRGKLSEMKTWPQEERPLASVLLSSFFWWSRAPTWPLDLDQHLLVFDNPLPGSRSCDDVIVCSPVGTLTLSFIPFVSQYLTCSDQAGGMGEHYLRTIVLMTFHHSCTAFQSMSDLLRRARHKPCVCQVLPHLLGISKTSSLFQLPPNFGV